MRINNDKETRKFLVLGHIVKEYVETASPVSSKAVVKRMRSNISSATIRNIMARLEDEGYIGQPHTSAGRIPTNFGYREYVDQLKEHIRFEKRQAQRLALEYTRRIRTIKDVLETTSHIISTELKNAGLVLWPSIEDVYLKHFELVKINAETILAVLVTMTNAVKNHIINLDRELEKAELARITNYINSNFEQSSFMDISESLRNELGDADADLRPMARAIIDAIIDKGVDNDISFDGLDYFMQESEFRDFDITRKVFKAFSDRRDLVRFLRSELPERGVRIYIGSENSSDGLKECSVVTGGYSINGRTVGRIGVIGPTRMDYDRSLRTIACLSNLISEKLESLNA